jgi:alkanesulfonate monooxygenase SsuD/methylene tetrahydromethanopterin reductase-like flavin-dependent oxidoreductase (luciferase family)
LLAKSLTQVDLISGGRLDVGLGLGWALQEYAATGAARAGRGARSEEFLRCLAAIWGEQPAQFQGEFFTVPPSYVQPRPLQRPHPPVLLGGSAERALRRAGRLADGWISGSGQDLRQIGDAIGVVRDAAREAGRDPAGLRFVCRGVVRLRPGGRADRRLLTGCLDEIQADLDELREAGVTEVFADLNFDQEIGSPEADPAASLRRAHEVLDALAPG